MDNLVWIVYVLSMLDILLVFTGIATAVFAGLLVARQVCLADAIDCAARYSGWDDKVAYWKAFGFKRYLVPLIVLLLTVVVIPNEKTAYKILAVHVGAEVLQTDAATELGNKSLQVINSVLDTYIGEHIPQSNKVHTSDD